MESRYIWMDGKLVEFANATVHFLNVGLHYGMAVFEGIRCYNTDKGPAVFRLQEHAERLIDSAHVLGMRDLPWCADDVAAAIKQTIAANEFSECYIRPVIWLAEGGWNINVDGAKPHLGIATWAWGAYLGEAAIEATRVITLSDLTTGDAMPTQERSFATIKVFRPSKDQKVHREDYSVPAEGAGGAAAAERKRALP